MRPLQARAAVGQVVKVVTVLEAAVPPTGQTTTALPAPGVLGSSRLPMTGLQALPTMEPRTAVRSV
jgi:hypothetical protein